MSSKSGDPLSWQRGVALQLASTSLAGRLSVLFTAASFAILSATGFLLYLLFAKGIYQDEARNVTEQIALVRTALIANPELTGSAGARIRSQYDSLDDMNYGLRVIAPNHRVVFETPGLGRLLPEYSFPPAADVVRPATERHHERRTYIVGSALVEGGSPDETRIVQLAYDGTDESRLLSTYRDNTLVALSFGAVATVLLGAVVARRGLRPLRDITQSTERITAASLDERIGERTWPRELVSLATAFDRMLARLESAMARLSQFSADLAHELRTPLANMIGEAEVTLAKRRSEDEYRGVIESGLEECQRLSRMVEELLFLARAEGNGVLIEKRRVDLREVADAVKSLYDMVAEDRGITFTCEGAASATVSPPLVSRTLTNLVSNAFKFTPTGGKVAISVARVPHGGEITVEDSGCGIPKCELPKIFDRFYRVDTARSRSSEGWGLGLAIVRSIVDLHGGRIDVTSEVERGTRVTLCFPDV